MKPKVSAIISTYNSEKFIVGKIEDLLSQTIFNEIEIIIINSGSLQDEENKIIPFLDKHTNIKYFKTPQRETIYKAWNRAIKEASGKYITNANTDDRLRPDALELLSNELDKNPSVGLVYGDQYITPIENEPFTECKSDQIYHRLNYSRIMILSEYIPGSQSMWRAEIHSKHGILFNEKYEVAGDYDFVLRVAELYDFKRLDAVLGSYYKSKSNSNKEYQNLSTTLSEVEEIKSIYRRRYVESLTMEEKKLLLKKAANVNKIPSKLISLYKRILIALNSRSGFPQKLFWEELEKLLREHVYES